MSNNQELGILLLLFAINTVIQGLIAYRDHKQSQEWKKEFKDWKKANNNWKERVN
jgi:hypothetical protein